MNRLAKEKSPYLLQHAANPVDWHPWGEEAFKKAKAEDKPIFLSIGYSTCHWCHVMEHESFENSAIAKILNDDFVSIKVDREERPDIDHVYMSYVMAVTGSGGWPMSVFLTPDQKPFYGGTYFPPVDRWGVPGFPSLLTSIREAWKNKRGEILESADSAKNFLSDNSKLTMAGPIPEKQILDTAFQHCVATFDEEYGGFGRAPKFPRSHTLTFLLRYSARHRNAEARRIAESTLKAMADGGIFDQIGGGFHRYSTDARWRIPHFEKMLYDQALLVRTYTEAFWLTRDPFYENVARKTADYVLREMTDRDGAFFSAQDADSADPEARGEKKEGAFFVWKLAEVDNLLGADAPIAVSCFGLEEGGNAIADPHQEFSGKNVLYRAASVEDVAARFSKKPSEIAGILDRCASRLFEARQKRPTPHLDDKVLLDWNALMITALAEASVFFSEQRYREAAVRAAKILIARLHPADDVWLRRWRDGEAALPANQADLSFLIEAFIALYETTMDGAWLDLARRTADIMVNKFADPEGGGFYLTAHDAEVLISRPKEFYDGAVPSGNSVAAYALLRLARLTFDDRYEALAQRTLASFSAMLSKDPANSPVLLMALDWWLGPSREIAVISPDGGHEPFMTAIRRDYYPWQAVVVSDKPIGDKKSLSGKTTVYVCRDKTCRQPVSQLDDLRKEL